MGAYAVQSSLVSKYHCLRVDPYHICWLHTLEQACIMTNILKVINSTELIVRENRNGTKGSITPLVSSISRLGKIG